MSELHLVLISRRFWPLVGGAEKVMANLAVELQNQGIRVTFLTAQWEKDWATQIQHRGISVMRLPHPSLAQWGTLRYMHAVSRWLKRHRHTVDGVCVSMLKHDAFVAVRALQKTPIPVVLRAEGTGTTGDCAWHHQGRFGNRIRQGCQRADAVIGASDAMLSELQEAGFHQSQIHHIFNGVAVGDLATAATKQQARDELANEFAPMAVEQDAPIVVFTGRLHPCKGLSDLVASWETVNDRYPKARLWLIGTGPLQSELLQQATVLGLAGKILNPRPWYKSRACESVLRAADLFVLPSYEEGMSISLLEAMAVGTPVIATNIEGNRKLIKNKVTGQLVPTHSPDALGAAIIELIERREQASQMASRAHQQVRQDFSLERMAKEHRELFERLIPAKQKRQ